MESLPNATIQRLDKANANIAMEYNPSAMIASNPMPNVTISRVQDESASMKILNGVINVVIKIYEAIRSSFGSGAWFDEKSWIDEETWKD